MVHALPPVSAVSPLRYLQFSHELAAHPDHHLVSYVLEGIRHGFRLGFDHSSPLSSAKRNKPSAFKNPDVIDNYLSNEVSLGRLAGPFSSPPFPNLHVSSFGVIPKRGQVGQWRLIVDLSSPTGASVNDGIDPDAYSLQYITLDQVIAAVSQLGPGALMAKFDVEAAFRNLAVHPDDRHLLGLKWRQQFYVDLTLPFGLRSAPFIFNSVANLVEWILRHNYFISLLFHYLDDYITAGPPNSPQCAHYLQLAKDVCTNLGLPLHPGKCIGPCTCMVVLGIELNSISQVASLPQDKLAALLSLLHAWHSKRVCRRKELESLIGHLHFACKVVWPGRTFLRRMIDLLCCFRWYDHPIRLNHEFHLDLQWWLQFLPHWNGMSFWLFPGLIPLADFHVTSDAAGSLGFGAFFHNEWFCGQWSSAQFPLSIAYKELFPIVVAAHLWGSQWFRKTILFRCDNQAVVAILASRTSKDPSIMLLLRHLLMSAAKFNFAFTAQHVPGLDNRIADAISRFQWQVFRQLAPQADLVPLAIPSQLLQSLTPLS